MTGRRKARNQTKNTRLRKLDQKEIFLSQACFLLVSTLLSRALVFYAVDLRYWFSLFIYAGGLVSLLNYDIV